MTIYTSWLRNSYNVTKMSHAPFLVWLPILQCMHPMTQTPWSVSLSAETNSTGLRGQGF